MKTPFRFLLAILCLLTVPLLHAQVPQLINYQGRVAVGTTNFNGSGTFRFALVNAAGTTTYWSNDGTGVAGSQPTAAVTLTVTKGLYSVLLGDTTLANMTAIPSSVFANADVRLRVWFNDGTNGSQLLTPDQRIAAVGYALVAGTLTANPTIPGTVTATAFNGDGSGLTNLPATAAPRRNPQQIAMLRWYEGIQTGHTFPAGTNPIALAFDGASIWVANYGSNNITKLRASDGAALGTFATGTSPYGVAFDGANIWVANYASNNITKLRASDGVLLGTFPTGTNPGAVAFDGANIWIVNITDSNVTKLRASDGAAQGTFPVGSGPYALAFDGANIWVSSYVNNNVTKLRASDGAVQGTFPVGANAHALAFDGANIWVANYGGNNITKLRASDGAVLGTFATGTNPDGVAFDGANIWVSNNVSNNVIKLRASDGALLGAFPVGTNPYAVAFDGTSIWVANYLSSTVNKL